MSLSQASTMMGQHEAGYTLAWPIHSGRCIPDSSQRPDHDSQEHAEWVGPMGLQSDHPSRAQLAVSHHATAMQTGLESPWATAQGSIHHHGTFIVSHQVARRNKNAKTSMRSVSSSPRNPKLGAPWRQYRFMPDCIVASQVHPGWCQHLGHGRMWHLAAQPTTQRGGFERWRWDK
jgi:hypothetical protein